VGRASWCCKLNLPNRERPKRVERGVPNVGAGCASGHRRGAHRQCHQGPRSCPTNVAPNKRYSWIVWRCPGCAGGITSMMAENSPRPLPQGTPRGLTVLDACGPTSLTAAGTSSVRTSALGRLHYDRFMYAAAVSQTNVCETSSAPAIPAQLRRPGTPTAFGAAAGRDYAACDSGRYAAGCAGQRAGICRGVMCGSEAFPGTDIGAIGGSGCALGRSRAGRSSLLNSVFAAQL
jgi:hypothetical protein